MLCKVFFLIFVWKYMIGNGRNKRERISIRGKCRIWKDIHSFFHALFTIKKKKKNNGINGHPSFFPFMNWNINRLFWFCLNIKQNDIFFSLGLVHIALWRSKVTYSVFEVSIINNNPKLSVTESFPPKVATYWSLSRHRFQRISFYLSSLFLIETNIMLQALVSASAFMFKVSSRVIALCKCFNYFYTFRYTLTPLLSNHIPVIKIFCSCSIPTVC